jgi:SAM-dependent methyltransferase
MSIQDVQNALFNTNMTEGDAAKAEDLCQVFIQKYWEWRYAETMKNYDHPVWFPHRLDMANWHTDRNPHFLERGIYSHQVIMAGDDVLELCCGDGFYSYYFLSGKAASVDSLDIDDLALSWARKYHSAPNINFLHINIAREPFPKSKYNVVVWDGAMRRLKRDDIEVTLDKVVEVLRPTDGVFSSYVELQDVTEPYLTPLGLADMKQLLQSRFPVVEWVRTSTPGRPNNYYFHCYMSDKKGRPGRTSNS